MMMVSDLEMLLRAVFAVLGAGALGWERERSRPVVTKGSWSEQPPRRFASPVSSTSGRAA